MRLISTDFDGTLIGFDSDGKCSPAFARALESHHQSGGMWAINTGRSLDHAMEGLEKFGAPVSPDFLLTNEREIFQCTGEGVWVSHGDWNDECVRRHAHLFSIAGDLFAEVRHMAETQGGITIIYEEEVPAGLITTSEERMHEVVRELEVMIKKVPDFSFQRNTIYLRFCHRDYHKGASLGELCRLESIPPEEVMAAGDHFNDLSMLDGSYARMTACPANAIEPVKQAVRDSKGYVAEASWADGIAEAMQYFRTRQGAAAA